ncbi:DNA binding protein [Bacillus phage BillyBob]|nr:DNA binding protein [Bacillus phage BillyBob]
MHEMTATFTERQAIERMMNYIEEERARLYTEYVKNLDRLRELDDIDRMSEQAAKVDEVMSEAYERPMVSIEDVEQANKNAREEFRKIIPEVMEEIKAHFDKMKEEEKEQRDNDFQPTNLCNEVEQPDIPPLNVDEPKVDEPKEKPSAGLEPGMLQMKKTLMRGTTNDNKVVSQFAKVILKENVEPMKGKKLVEALNNTGIQMKHPHETLRQIMLHEPTIQRVAHGYYQYVK